VNRQGDIRRMQQWLRCFWVCPCKPPHVHFEFLRRSRYGLTDYIWVEMGAVL
jgi:hypothetical protein